MWNLFLVICLSIISLSHGQGYNFFGIENEIQNLLDNTRALQNMVYAEKMKYQPHAPNVTGQGTLTITQNAFTTDVENRLREMSSTVNRLVSDLRICPGSPQLPIAPENVTVTTVTVGKLSTINVGWLPPKPEPENMQFRVHFLPMDSYGNPIAQKVSFSICDKTQTSASITDLMPNTHFRITVSTLAGPSREKQSAPIGVKTYDQVPPSPTFLNAFGVTPNSVTLRWDKPDMLGNIIAYQIHGKNTLGEKFTEIVKPPVEQYVVTNLPEGTEHVFIVHAESDNGQGDGSPRAIVNTLPFDPPPPINLQCAHIGFDAITLTWTPPPMYQGSGTVRGYNITMKDDMFNVMDYFVFEDINTSTTNITNLTADSILYFTASSFTRRRQGDPGIIVSCKTEPTFPSPPRKVLTYNNTFDPPSALITWTPSQFRNDKSLHYSVQWGVVNGAKRVENVTGGTMFFKSDYLDHNENHSFVITAVNSVGHSKPVTVYFKTPNKEVLVPPNVTVQRSNTDKNVLLVKWELPSRKIYGYRVLFRKFEWVYTGRWKLAVLHDPTATSTEIKVKDAGSSYIVVIRCILDPQGSPYNPGPVHPNRGNPIYYQSDTHGQMQYQGPPRQGPNPNYPPQVPPPGNYQPNVPPPQNYPQNAVPQNVGSNQRGRAHQQNVV